MLIGVDICNTLACLMKAVSSRFGIPLDELDAHYDYRDFGISNAFWESSEGLMMFSQCDAFKTAPEALQTISKLFKVVYVTARPEIARLITRVWLQRNGFPDAPVVLATDKVKVVRELGIGLIVEDAPHYIEALSKEVPVIAKDYGYNRHLDVPRFTNWVDFLDLFFMKGGCPVWSPSVKVAR